VLFIKLKLKTCIGSLSRLSFACRSISLFLTLHWFAEGKCSVVVCKKINKQNETCEKKSKLIFKIRHVQYFS